MRVNGNINNIKDSYIEILDKIYDMSVKSEEIISNEILDIIIEISSLLKKEIAVFVNRRGIVVDVSVGDYSSVNLSIIDYRRGNRRLSGVRCIHTHPENSGQLSSVDLSALVSMRLDSVIAVGIEDGKSSDIYIGYITPIEGVITDKYGISGPHYREALNIININEFVKEIEKSIKIESSEKVDENRKERVFLVGVSTPGEEKISEDLIEELGELAVTTGAELIGKVMQKRNKIDTATFIGSGKAHELNMISQAYDVDTIIFDDELSGAQVRNLEDITGTKVIDRTTLILDIFAKRAQTKEGKLQVELAQLKYMMPRLIGLGKVLSRTGGGIGTRGPGEKKLETDRRHIRERVEELEDALEEVKKNRDVQRQRRKQSSMPIVSLVGYTNSGKSTLRNKLARMYQPNSLVVKDDVLEADMLFATLDPTTRQIKLPKGREILVSDTVGFIRKLPHDLVDAFRATLEEVIYSDMIIHVVDSSAENAVEQIKAVNNVLKELNAQDKPTIIALNKTDKISNNDTISSLRSGLENNIVEISALNGDGIDNLLAVLDEMLFNHIKIVTFKIPYDSMSVKSSLYREASVINEEYDENSVIIVAEVDDIVCNKYNRYVLKE